MYLCLTFAGSDGDDPGLAGERMIVNAARISYVEELPPNERGAKCTVWFDEHMSNKFWGMDVFESVEYIASKLQAV